MGRHVFSPPQESGAPAQGRQNVLWEDKMPYFQMTPHFLLLPAASYAEHDSMNITPCGTSL